jgi:dUTP pyrophosphatase
MARRFEVLPGYAGVALPERGTAASAGYDLAAAEEIVVPAGGVAFVPTGLRAILPEDEFLAIYARSSIATRRGLVLANGVGVVDADYAHNPDNGGHILVALRNLGTEPARIVRGERVAQAIFQRYALIDADRARGARLGGFGSTG